MLRTPTPRSGMPFFRPVEAAARNLRPLSDHRLIVSPLLTPPASEAPSLRSRVAGRSQSLLGGVAVLAVAGALSAGMGASGRATSASAAHPVDLQESGVAGLLGVPGSADGGAATVGGLAGVGGAATVGGPAGVGGLAGVGPASPAAIAPVAYAAQAPATAMGGATDAASHTNAIAHTATGRAPAVSIDPRAPRGAAVVSHQDTVNVRAMSGALHRLRSCESGGNYREASGNGYYGAYQFDLSTWRSLGLSGYPSNASHQLQDVAVTRLQARKGWGPWPVCSYVAGLR